MRTIIVESHDLAGPHVAKEASEALRMAVLPAIANAVPGALKFRPTGLPVAPDRVPKSTRSKR